MNFKPHTARIFLLMACTAASVATFAQSPEADPILAPADDAPPSQLHFTGDLWLGHDHVSGLPNNRADIDRTRGRLRFGAIWSVAPDWEVTATARIAGGSDSNRDNRRNNDNERSNDFGVDQVLVRWRASENASLQFGKAPLPLDLSPMLWDPDLRPAHIAESAFEMERGLAAPGAREMDQPGFIPRFRSGFGKSGDGDGDMPSRVRQGALGHGACGASRHRAVGFQDVEAHAQHLVLGLVCVDDEASLEGVRAAGDVRQQRGQ